MLPILILLATVDRATVALTGKDFEGGGKLKYSSNYRGEDVDYAYAKSNGPLARMSAQIELENLPKSRQFLIIKGLDDDGPGICPILIAINGRTLFEGPNPFSQEDWDVHRFEVPSGTLRKGKNELTIYNQVKEGEPGMPPWFMISRCAIANENYQFPLAKWPEFMVNIPREIRSLPEPLKPGEGPGFAVRGIKGWMWPPEAYIEVIPTLKAARMNFLMNCYTSMCDIEHYAWGDPHANRWWEPLPNEKRAKYEAVVRECQRNGINFCFSMNPCLNTTRALNYRSDKDIDDLYQHYSWMQGLGVKWFNISMDDIGEGIDPAGQSHAVNEIYRRLKVNDPDVNFIFCPTPYWGDGSDAWSRSYLEVVAQVLDPDIYLFWTGDQVVGKISSRACKMYKAVAKHRLFIWDNYPVNDDNPTLHLGPVLGRDPDLSDIAAGYMSNSMCKPRESNRIPILTCGDYAYNPRSYDPNRSIGQAILHLYSDKTEQRAIADFVELYPGMIRYGEGTWFNPVRARFQTLRTERERAVFVSKLQSVADRLRKLFPGQYSAELAVIKGDLTAVRKQTKR